VFWQLPQRLAEVSGRRVAPPSRPSNPRPRCQTR